MAPSGESGAEPPISLVADGRVVYHPMLSADEVRQRDGNTGTLTRRARPGPYGSAPVRSPTERR
jgi:hypothetical protein